MAIAALEPTVQNSEIPDVSTERNELGRSDFLKMFITQMQYQDPLNPLEGAEFMSQLAQFSSLEQLFNLNDNSEKMLETQDSLGRMQALNLIGKEVLSEGNGLGLQEGSTVQGFFLLPEAASACRIAIYDPEGNPVRTLDLGEQEGGEHHFRWDGLDSSGKALPTGMYNYEIWAKSLAGETLAAQTRTSGVVTGVKLGDLVPLVTVGEMEIPLTQVFEVRSHAPASAEEQDTN
jgi:flagellar basal-body rod modification protein FlgD